MYPTVRATHPDAVECSSCPLTPAECDSTIGCPTAKSVNEGMDAEEHY